MLTNLNAQQLEILAKAVTLIDYEKLFSYYGYKVGRNGGCWMIARAVQWLAGGQLHYVELDVHNPGPDTFLHVVVKLGEDAFMDGRGLHTAEELLNRWSFETTEDCDLVISPLFVFPVHLECEEDMVSIITDLIKDQMDALKVIQQGIAEMARQVPA